MSLLLSIFLTISTAVFVSHSFQPISLPPCPPPSISISLFLLYLCISLSSRLSSQSVLLAYRLDFFYNFKYHLNYLRVENPCFFGNVGLESDHAESFYVGNLEIAFFEEKLSLFHLDSKNGIFFSISVSSSF